MHELQRITTEEFPFGAALPFAVFDANGRLIYAKGTVIGSVGVSVLMLARGLYRKLERVRQVSFQ